MQQELDEDNTSLHTSWEDENQTLHLVPKEQTISLGEAGIYMYNTAYHVLLVLACTDLCALFQNDDLLGDLTVTASYSPFKTRTEALLYMLLNSPRPIVS